MSFPFSDHLAALGLSQREIERSNRVAVVSAPDDWTDARIEAWLDWAGA